MKILIEKCPEPYHLIASNYRGNNIHMDSKSPTGGKDKGMSPMETLLASLGGCASMDVLNILEKQKQLVQEYEVVVNAEREEKDELPRVFTNINVHFVFFSDELDEKKVEKAIALSMDKYCSVARMLEETAELTYSFKIEAPKMIAEEKEDK